MAENKRANQNLMFCTKLLVLGRRLSLFIFIGMISLAEAQDWLNEGKTLTDSDLERTSGKLAIFKDPWRYGNVIKKLVCVENATHIEMNIVGEAVCRSIGSSGFEGRISHAQCIGSFMVLVRCRQYARSLEDCRVFTDTGDTCCRENLEVKCESDKPPKKEGGTKLSTPTILGIVSACLTATGACCSGCYWCCKYKMVGDAVEADIHDENERMRAHEMAQTGTTATTAPLMAGNDATVSNHTSAPPPSYEDAVTSTPSHDRV